MYDISPPSEKCKVERFTAKKGLSHSFDSYSLYDALYKAPRRAVTAEPGSGYLRLPDWRVVTGGWTKTSGVKEVQLTHQLSTGYIQEVMPEPALTRILNSLRTRGLIRTSVLVAQAGFCKLLGERIGTNFLKMIWRNEGMRFDRKYGVCTAHFVSIKTLNVVGQFSKFGSAYAAARPIVLREVFSRIPIDYRQFTFVDFGSGMGRVLLWASDLPFSEIVGVEFSPELHEIAQRNIQQYRSKHQRCFSIRSECLGAEDFSLPEGNLVLFFNNPFGPPVMELVLKRLEQALLDRPERQVWVVYLKPTCGFLMDDAPFLERVAQSTTSNYYWYSVYRSLNARTDVQ